MIELQIQSVIGCTDLFEAQFLAEAEMFFFFSFTAFFMNYVYFRFIVDIACFQQEKKKYVGLFQDPGQDLNIGQNKVASKIQR